MQLKVAFLLLTVIVVWKKQSDNNHACLAAGPGLRGVTKQQTHCNGDPRVIFSLSLSFSHSTLGSALIALLYVA